MLVADQMLLLYDHLLTLDKEVWCLHSLSSCNHISKKKIRSNGSGRWSNCIIYWAIFWSHPQVSHGGCPNLPSSSIAILSQHWFCTLYEHFLFILMWISFLNNRIPISIRSYWASQVRNGYLRNFVANWIYPLSVSVSVFLTLKCQVCSPTHNLVSVVRLTFHSDCQMVMCHIDLPI